MHADGCIFQDKISPYAGLDVSEGRGKSFQEAALSIGAVDVRPRAKKLENIRAPCMVITSGQTEWTKVR